jgi:hypothetical protein
MSDEQKALERQTGMARPSWIPQGDVSGTEHITKADAKMPRLALAQLQHTNPEEACYVRGVKLGDFFNDLDKTVIYGPGPFYFTVVRGDTPRWIEFIPRDQGGGVKDMDVKPGDPRTKFRNVTTDKGKERLPPIASCFYDFVILIRFGEKRDEDGNLVKKYERVLPIALSFKSTGIKHAQILNGLIQGRMAPLYTGVYRLESTTSKNKKGTFKTYNITNAGWIGEEEGEALAKLMAVMAEKDVDFDRGPDDTDGEDDADFPHGANSPEDAARARAAARATSSDAGM